ncbi:MAG: ABC transporter permease [Subdoligranulum sp.]|nr:ABC transporter permease [Subdoligranulum sp.]MBD5101708.1 ABC transporter permease [Subdoligranulum sp.]
MNKKLNAQSVTTFIKNWAAVIAIVLLIGIFAIMRPTSFLTLSNFETIMRSISINTVLAMSLTVTLAVGGFDLAAGALASVSGYFVMSYVLWYGTNFWLALLITIVFTLVLQCVTMFLVIKCKIPDLLATCAMMFVLQGIGLTYTGGGAISAGMARPDGEASVGSVPNIMKTIGTSPTIIIIMLVCVVIVHLFLTYTKYGRYIYAVGGNKTAAKLSGIPVKKYRFIAGMIAALFIAFTGVLVASRNQSAQIQGAEGYQMYALAAVFIGRSVAGQEKPNAVGTLIGAILVGILDNGLIMVGVPYYSLNAVKGAVLAIALIAAYASTKED